MRSIYEILNSLTCDDVLTCFYGLKELDAQVYKVLVKKGQMKIDEISTILERRENTVYKSLQRLMAHGLVIRRQEILRKGGYYFLYQAIDPSRVVNEMKEVLKEWYSKIQDVLDEFHKEVLSDEM
jgi:predicted transcriptional regulator